MKDGVMIDAKCLKKFVKQNSKFFLASFFLCCLEACCILLRSVSLKNVVSVYKIIQWLLV